MTQRNAQDMGENTMRSRQTTWVTWGLMAMLLVVSGLAVADDATKSETSKKKKTIDSGDLANKALFQQQRFKKLVTDMVKLANLIEDSDPESARILIRAANEAGKALISKDMEKAAKLIREGLTNEALLANKDAARELKRIYAILMDGEVDLDERLKRVQAWKETLAELSKILDKQKKLEDKSSLAKDAKKHEAAMKELGEKIQSLLKDQEKLLNQTRKVGEVNEQIRQLARLRDKVRQAQARQADVSRATNTSGTDKLPLAGEKQKALADETDGLKKAIEEAMSDQNIAKLVKQADAAGDVKDAAKRAGEAAGEMGKASRSLKNSDALGASKPQKQAKADLAAAEKALSDAIAKAGKGTPAGQLAEKQKELEDVTRQVASAMEKMSQTAGADSKSGQSG
ncbi:MAG: hypothetical protein ACOCZU_05270, partial [Planctomycetota bacterium]